MKNRSALAILFVIVFIDLLGFGMVIPVMPLYAKRLGASEAWTGLLSAGYSAMQFVFAPIWGRLSDRIGRRPMLLGSIVMTAVAFALYGLAGSFPMLLISRLFAGAATANIAIARAFVADVTAPEDRARGMGIIGAAFGLGFVLGPAIGGVLSNYSLSLPGFAAAALAAVNGVAAWFILPEPEHRFSVDRRPRFAAMREELARPGIRRVIGSTSSRCSRSARWRRPTRSSRAQRYGLAGSSVELRVRLHRRDAGDRAGRARRPTHPPLRREVPPRRRPRPAGDRARLAPVRRRLPRAPRDDRAARDRRGPHAAGALRAAVALRAREIRAARSGLASPPPRSAVSSVPRRGRGRSGSGPSRFPYVGGAALMALRGRRWA